MVEPLRIAEGVADKIPGLAIIAGFLDVAAPQTQPISRYLASSWQKLSTAVRDNGVKKHPHIEQWRAALRRAGVPLKKCPPSIQKVD